MKQCILCKTEIPETSARTKFCSEKCSVKDRNHRHRKPLVAYEPIPCKNCGKMFTPKQANSVACGRLGCKAVRVPRLKYKICRTCGNEITTKTRKKYCSDRCAAKLSRKYEDKACIYCGEIFSPKNSRVQTCQKPECLKIHQLTLQNTRHCADAEQQAIHKDRVTTKCPRCEKLYEKTFLSGWLGRGIPRYFCNCCSKVSIANNSVSNEYSVRI
jgi:predicted nucleic acid-binding Zn ribbon protein